jgi:hypothetical protein
MIAAASAQIDGFDHIGGGAGPSRTAAGVPRPAGPTSRQPV